MKYLLDVNVLIALTQPDHIHFKTVTNWFDTPGRDWGICAFSEAGFLRLSSNPSVGNLTLDEATAILATLARHPGYRYWPISVPWMSLVEPFAERVLGHQQVADALLLGLAIKENGVLVTLDKGIRYMAGPRYAHHLHVLE
jgi:toxin-antitoxin system PIN domain toxin